MLQCHLLTTNCCQGLEKYLMTKLFDRTFGVDALDRERDAAVEARLRALAFVRPEHLEVEAHLAADSSLLLAQKELARINLFKVCVTCCNASRTHTPPAAAAFSFLLQRGACQRQRGAPLRLCRARGISWCVS
jgi:hypothetical protein